MNVSETTVLFLQCISVELAYVSNLIQSWLVKFFGYIFYSFFFLQNTMLQSIERYMKQAIVDKNHAVSSAALVSSLVMLQEMH